MTAGLETFAKVRALHDRTDNSGEKAAAMLKMQTLARKVGMTVDEAVSTLDAPAPAPKPRNFFEDLFNTPEFRADRAEREAKRRTKAAVLIEEYGSEDAVFADTPREAALRAACAPLLGLGETWRTRHEIAGWGALGGRSTMPASVRAAVSAAWPLPATVAAAWAEYEAAEKLSSDRYTVDTYCDPEVFVNARQYVIEEMLDTMPAKSLNDLRARVSWMEWRNDLETAPNPAEERVRLATLRADVERMGAREDEQDAAPCEDDQGLSSTEVVQSGQATKPIETGRCDSVQDGQAEGWVLNTHPLRRTNADKRRDVLALIRANAETHGIAPLSDREIARRAGVSPQTVGNIRRAQR